MTKQRVLVTAGASGIGREIVRAFYAVFVRGIDPNALTLEDSHAPRVAPVDDFCGSWRVTFACPFRKSYPDVLVM